MEKDGWSISFKQLGLLIIIFMLGIACTLLMNNIFSNEVLSFKTTDIISFILSVVLASASIVLAIAAIHLGKSSEQAVIKRSDESIRLQNEVFVRTTEALQRIEATTGVTEKRIEDIISGRVGNLPHRLSEIATGQRPGIRKSKTEIEKEIRNALVNELTPEGLAIQEILKKKQADYKEFHQSVLSSFANRGDLKVSKTAHGDFKAVGHDLFDGIFIKDDKSVGVSALDEEFNVPKNINDYIFNIAKAIITGEISRAFIIIKNLDEKGESAFKEFFAAEMKILKDNPNENIVFIGATTANVEQKINDLIIS